MLSKKHNIVMQVDKVMEAYYIKDILRLINNERYHLIKRSKAFLALQMIT